MAAALPDGLTTVVREGPDTKSMRTSEPKVSVDDSADSGATVGWNQLAIQEGVTV